MTLVTNLIMVVYLLLVLASMAACGRRLLAFFQLCHASETERNVLGIGLALGATSLLMAAAGFLGVLQPAVAWIVLCAALAFGVPELRQVWKSVTGVGHLWKEVSAPQRVFLVLGAAALTAYGLSALAPPLEGDSLAGYLSVPAAYLREGVIHAIDHKWYDDLPLNVQMLTAFALMLQGELLSQMLVGFGMTLLCIGVLLAFSRRWFSPAAFGVGAAIFVLTGEVAYGAASTKIDLGWAFFELLLLFCFGGWLAEGNDRWLLLGGLFGGLALGSKYTAAYSLVVLAVALAVWHVPAFRRRAAGDTGAKWSAVDLVRRGALLLSPALALGAIWPLKNLVYTGSPLYPLFNEFFTGDQLIQSVRHADGVLGFMRIWWDMSVGYVTGTFGKPVGPALLAILPGVFLLQRVPRALTISLVYVAAVAPLWYLGLQYPRNLLPALAILALVCGSVFEALTRQRSLLRAALPIVLFVPLAVGLLDYARINLVSVNRLAYSAGFVTREAFLDRNLGPLYPSLGMVKYINGNLPPDARILALMNGNDYYLRPTLVQSNELDARAIHAAETDSAALTVLRRLRLTHVYINDYVLDLYRAGYGTHTPYQPTLLEHTEFQTRFMQELFASGPQRLYRLCLEPQGCDQPGNDDVQGGRHV